MLTCNRRIARLPSLLHENSVKGSLKLLVLPMEKATRLTVATAVWVDESNRAMTYKFMDSIVDIEKSQEILVRFRQINHWNRQIVHLG